MRAGAQGPIGVWFLLTSLLVQPATTLADEVVASLSFNRAQLTFQELDGYDLVSLDGADYSTDPGRPMLPQVSVQVLLPPGTTALEVEAVPGGTVYLPGDFEIVPAPRPVRLSTGAAAEIPQPDAETYGSIVPYPRTVARLAGAGSIDEYRVASLLVYPLSYIPAQGRLLLHTAIDIVVTATPLASHRTSPEMARASSAQAREMVSRGVINPDGLAMYPSPCPGETRGSVAEAKKGIDYLLICPESLAGEFQPLADWKTRKGVRAEVVSLEAISRDPAYDGVDQAEEIRNCILEYHQLHGITWVLLGGDTELLPSRNAYDFLHNQGLPCDLYYADLDGTWNADSDEKWGEFVDDELDMYSDVFVGRAPVSDADETRAFVNKALRYEGAGGSVHDDYQLRMLFLAEILWDHPNPYTDGGVALDMIDDSYVPSRFEPVAKLYERDGSLGLAATLHDMNEGCGIISHVGHANTGTVSIGPDRVEIQDIDDLTNAERGGIWYSVGCFSGAIDRDAIGEHWLTNPSGGGVAYVGNSRYGWACPGYPGECISDLYNQQFFNSLFVKDLAHAGSVHADAKHVYVGTAAFDAYMLYTMYGLNLLGDPETPIWTDVPKTLTVSHPPHVSWGIDGAQVDVTVNALGVPVDGASVCLMTEDDVYYDVKSTDSQGGVTFDLDPMEPRDLLVTITARNAVPYLGAIKFTGGSPPAGGDGSPLESALLHGHPNPFATRTSIAYTVSAESHVTMTVHDVGGREVAVLADCVVGAGTHAVRWDGCDSAGRKVASGVYFVRMMTTESLLTKKLIVMR